ncbi:urease subunit beta [Mycobacterium sp. 155]|uniref:urease subunit beta n=1 Tax=Mycobacterium sp. 155 TaxID=1157943 RepID=UPI0012F73012|nr:urease subunit beta [Mycobacterium sp. 155]
MTYRTSRQRHAELGPHFHFFEANRARRINRSAALGMRQGVQPGMRGAGERIVARQNEVTNSPTSIEPSGGLV